MSSNRLVVPAAAKMQIFTPLLPPLQHHHALLTYPHTSTLTIANSSYQTLSNTSHCTNTRRPHSSAILSPNSLPQVYTFRNQVLEGAKG